MNIATDIMQEPPGGFSPAAEQAAMEYIDAGGDIAGAMRRAWNIHRRETAPPPPPHPLEGADLGEGLKVVRGTFCLESSPIVEAPAELTTVDAAIAWFDRYWAENAQDVE